MESLHLGFVLLLTSLGGPLGDGCLRTCGACGACSAYQPPTELGWPPRTPSLVLPELRSRTFWFREPHYLCTKPQRTHSKSPNHVFNQTITKALTNNPLESLPCSSQQPGDAKTLVSGCLCSESSILYQHDMLQNSDDAAAAARWYSFKYLLLKEKS